MPCIETGTGICHVYVDAAADLDMALDIVENAKTSRPSVCNAEEVLLVHKDVAAQFLPMLNDPPGGRPRRRRDCTPVELRLDAAGRRHHRRCCPPGRRILTRNFWTTCWR